MTKGSTNGSNHSRGLVMALSVYFQLLLSKDFHEWLRMYAAESLLPFESLLWPAADLLNDLGGMAGAW